MSKAQRVTRREYLRRARILEKAADRIESNGWLRGDGSGNEVWYGEVPTSDCAYTGIWRAAGGGPKGVPGRWRRMYHAIVTWNDAQPGPEPVVAHLRASAAKYRAAAERCHDR